MAPRPNVALRMPPPERQSAESGAGPFGGPFGGRCLLGLLPSLLGSGPDRGGSLLGLLAGLLEGLVRALAVRGGVLGLAFLVAYDGGLTGLDRPDHGRREGQGRWDGRNRSGDDRDGHHGYGHHRHGRHWWPDRRRRGRRSRDRDGRHLERDGRTGPNDEPRYTIRRDS